MTKIEKEIDKLTSDQQLKLLERLIHRIKLMKKGHKRELDRKNFTGLVKDCGIMKMLRNMLIGHDRIDYEFHILFGEFLL